MLKVKFLVSYWVTRWRSNFQLKGTFVVKWILNLPLSIEFRIVEFVNIEHEDVSIEYCIFGRTWVKILNFRWILDFWLNVDFSHQILFFFNEYWIINEKSNFCWIQNSCWTLECNIKYWICNDSVLKFLILNIEYFTYIWRAIVKCFFTLPLIQFHED